MERFLDFIFAIAWWHWLLGTSVVAGVYYLAASHMLPFLKGVQDEREEEVERQREEEAEEERQRAAKTRLRERRKHLNTIPSGPVEAVELPPARVRVRNRYHPVPLNAETIFGIAQDATVRIMVRGISRHHAKIRPEPSGYVLYDLKSGAGTLVDGEAVPSKRLAHGDRFCLGPVDVLFEEIEGEDG
jgi:hypothetical protein